MNYVNKHQKIRLGEICFIKLHVDRYKLRKGTVKERPQQTDTTCPQSSFSGL